MLILLPLTHYAQDTLDCLNDKYPMTIVVNNDTVVAFTLEQEKCIYKWLEEKKFTEYDIELCEIMKTNCFEHIDVLNRRIGYYQLEISVMQENIDVKQNMINNLNRQVDNRNLYNYALQNDNKTLKRRNTRNIIIGGVAITGLTTALILSLLK